MAEKCPNLTHLNLSGNKIKDLSTIEPLVSHVGPLSVAGVGRIEIDHFPLHKMRLRAGFFF